MWAEEDGNPALEDLERLLIGNLMNHPTKRTYLDELIESERWSLVIPIL
jgi:hypothetical protein